MKSNVLVIEDDPIIGEMISMILEEQGIDVISLSDTTWAREKLNNGAVDLVLLDIKLTGEGGKSMCRYIKSHSNLKHIPVIFVSGNEDIKHIKEACGADDFIKKPFEMDHIVEKVTKYTRAVA
jgi:DNA-binding response OmpR family regulator